MGIVPDAARDLIVAGAILSIVANPLLFMVLDRLEARTRAGENAPPSEAPPAVPGSTATSLSEHAVVVGHGRVGRTVADGLLAKGVPLLVVDEEANALTALQRKGIETYHGVCGESSVLDRINLRDAHYLFSAIPDPYEAGHIIEAAREANSNIRIIARAHSEEAKTYLRSIGADVVLIGEDELGRSMVTAAVPA